MVNLNLKKIRLAKGVTQSHLAKKLNISNMAYGRMESGETKMDVERLKVISIALGLEIEVFFNDELTDSVINEMEVEQEVV
ncbi:helix-turn-helix domain-containing protein [Sporosarcina sp. FA9]|uniref:helix-turn-helix domain-containing protein n=1 Tax=Sporosarcina sp. FA9 TaxID=3413030 RepID=UPI003F659F49